MYQPRIVVKVTRHVRDEPRPHEQLYNMLIVPYATSQCHGRKVADTPNLEGTHQSKGTVP